jgi:hypothetical protein
MLLMAFRSRATNLKTIPNAAMARGHYMTAFAVMGFDNGECSQLSARMGRTIAGVEDSTAQTSET